MSTKREREGTECPAPKGTSDFLGGGKVLRRGGKRLQTKEKSKKRKKISKTVWKSWAETNVKRLAGAEERVKHAIGRAWPENEKKESVEDLFIGGNIAEKS